MKKTVFKFDQENFILNNFFVDWEDMLKTDELNADNSTRMHLDKINMFLDTYVPLKRITKYKLKFKSKPRIILGLQKPLSVENELLKGYLHYKTIFYNKVALDVQLMNFFI